MIHLSRFLIGVRHNRVFRFKSLAGQLVDNLVKELSTEFDRVNENREEFVLENAPQTIFARLNRDDIILENRKVYDIEAREYVEIDKARLINIAEKSLPVASSTLSLKDDYMRVGMIFEFRLPKWNAIEGDNFGKYICDKFVNFNTNEELSQGALRFVYKIPIRQGLINKSLKDFRNVIVRIDQSSGLNEQGKEEKCLLINVDIQRIYDPFRKDADIKEHFEFAQEHLRKVLIPEFKNKGIEICYE